MNRPHSPIRASLVHARAAFTLLEVILALALAVLVLAILGAAVNIYLRSTDTSRYEIESTQLARTLLSRISDDLRSTIRFEKFDSSSASSLTKGITKNATSAATGAGSAATGASGTSGSTGSAVQQATDAAKAAGASSADIQKATESATGAQKASTEDTTAAKTPEMLAVETPGVYGSMNLLQMDIAQRPGFSSRAPAVTAGAELPPGMRTVSYFVKTGEDGATGLYRRDIDRASNVWDVEQGGGDDQSQFDELLAEEVTGVEFNYWDGAEWFSDWDSSELGSPPVAVEILLYMALPTSRKASDGKQEVAETTYRMVVRIPSAKPTDSATTAANAAATEEQAAANTSPTNASSTTGQSTNQGTGGTSGR